MPANPDGTVVLCMVVAGGATAVGQIGQGHIPAVRVGVGVMVGTALLLVLGEFAPQISVALAVTTMLTALFVTGGPAWLALRTSLKGRTP